MVLVIVRLEKGLRGLVERLASDTDETVSSAARSLIRIGLGVKRAGGLEIRGRLGFRRPLADLDFGGRAERLGIRVEEELLEEVEREFGDVRQGMREAMRLGAWMLAPGEVKIVGLLGVERPLADVLSPELRDAKARRELERLRSLLGG